MDWIQMVAVHPNGFAIEPLLQRLDEDERLRWGVQRSPDVMAQGVEALVKRRDFGLIWHAIVLRAHSRRESHQPSGRRWFIEFPLPSSLLPLRGGVYPSP